MVSAVVAGKHGAAAPEAPRESELAAGAPVAASKEVTDQEGISQREEVPGNAKQEAAARMELAAAQVEAEEPKASNGNPVHDAAGQEAGATDVPSKTTSEDDSEQTQNRIPESVTDEHAEHTIDQVGAAPEREEVKADSVIVQTTDATAPAAQHTGVPGEVTPQATDGEPEASPVTTSADGEVDEREVAVIAPATVFDTLGDGKTITPTGSFDALLCEKAEPVATIAVDPDPPPRQRKPPES